MEFVTVIMTDSEETFELNAEEIDDGRWATTEIQTALITEPEKYSPTFRMIWGGSRISKNTTSFPH